jgi:DDE_Tnp_1-associated
MESLPLSDMPAPFSTIQVPSLVEALKAVPDFRSRFGKRYPLEAILTLAITAMLCGYDSYGAMAEWGKNYGDELAKELGFKKGRTPSVGTLFTVFSQVDEGALQNSLVAWNESVLATLGKPVALSADGKTLRGSRKQGATAPHLLAAVSHELGLCLGQSAVDLKENEIVAMKRLVNELVLKGRVVTMDALLTQKEIARAIVKKGVIL